MPRLAVALVVVAVFTIAGGIVKRIVRHRADPRSTSYASRFVIGRLVHVGSVIVGILVALTALAPSFNAGSIVQFLGISSVAIGFAFRDILANFMAGILLLLTRPFNIGDYIHLEAFEGTVEAVQTRATALRTRDGRRILIPNFELYTKSVIVDTAFLARRSEITVPIPAGSSLDPVREALRGQIALVEGVHSQPPPEVEVQEVVGTDEVQLAARWWTAAAVEETERTRDAVMRRVAAGVGSDATSE